MRGCKPCDARPGPGRLAKIGRAAGAGEIHSGDTAGMDAARGSVRSDRDSFLPRLFSRAVVVANRCEAWGGGEARRPMVACGFSDTGFRLWPFPGVGIAGVGLQVLPYHPPAAGPRLDLTGLRVVRARIPSARTARFRFGTVAQRSVVAALKAAQPGRSSRAERPTHALRPTQAAPEADASSSCLRVRECGSATRRGRAGRTAL